MPVIKEIKNVCAEDVDLEEIARLVQEGFISGKLDPEEGRHISWELKIIEWEDSESKINGR